MTSLTDDGGVSYREALRRGLLTHKRVSADALESTLSQYTEEELDWGTFQQLAVRLAGNLARLMGGLPVPRDLPPGRRQERCEVRVVRVISPEAAERAGEMDFLILTGLLAGLTAPGRPGLRAMAARRALDGRGARIPLLRDLLGADFTGLVEGEDGRWLIRRLEQPTPAQRARALHRYRYRYERRRRNMEPPCERHADCLNCDHGQLAGPGYMPCEYALRPAGLERRVQDVDQGAVPGVSGRNGAAPAAG